ncbi:TonB family protein [Mucilaginibacter frigoritolerans]|uniref:TonB family protein n=1 Tax=Mucilaginibacter frigoritolerans TaxID=652788 RepID=A0A562TX64_9SPHI|nr:energy transducer TonB [Mucilaginibacter frigoritolerans]TWI98219.1 TonB family protein [Mucilaginibacter frigoritolerans]
MLKPILITITGILLMSTVFAQKNDSSVYYLNKKGAVVNTKDDADYKMVFLPPDSIIDKSLFIIKGYYKSGKLKLLGYSKTNNLNLKFQGKVTVFFPDGHKMRITNYENGEMIGDIIEYYPNGMFYNRETITKLATGEEKTSLQDCSDSNGKVLAKNGNGTWLKLNSELTKVKEEGPVINGIEEGEWHSRKSDSVEIITEYKNGKIVSVASLYKSGEKIYSYVEKAPEFPGGSEGFSKFIGSNVKYPAEAKKNAVQGKVMISFVVEKDGSLSEIKTIKGIGSGCDEEAVIVMKLSPKWEPGIHNGKAVRVLLTLPITFLLGKKK